MNAPLHQSHLRCINCSLPSEHVVVYVGRIVSEVQCTNCGARTRLDVREEYLPDLGERIKSKPKRVWRRLLASPLALMRSLPGHLLTKPLRMLREMWLVWRS
ncbi:hypothetical protein ACUH9O_07890 [Dermabacteraceae bacterium P13103]